MPPVHVEQVDALANKSLSKSHPFTLRGFVGSTLESIRARATAARGLTTPGWFVPDVKSGVVIDAVGIVEQLSRQLLHLPAPPQGICQRGSLSRDATEAKAKRSFSQGAGYTHHSGRCPGGH